MVTVVWLRTKVTKEYHTPSDLIEVSAIVSEFNQRMKRLEEGLVDQKVKQEILELRMERRPQPSSILRPPLRDNNRELDDLEPRRPIVGRKLAVNTSRSDEHRLGSTEREVLNMVMEGEGRLTAREIQQRIGKTREHTARMMNALFQDGFVERDTTARPYSYSITDKGRNILGS
jgi:predicted transcriptional regulator